jgi:2-octaprenyl-6-methoxyphenol hydroxylase
MAARIQALDEAGYLAHAAPALRRFPGATSRWPARATAIRCCLARAPLRRAALALVGDAAHRVHPIAGQGLNAGLKDVAALAEVLTDAHRRGEDIGRLDVLERYQPGAASTRRRWRSRPTPSTGSSRTTIPCCAPGAISAWAGRRLPRLRRGFIREAAGLTGDLPRLLQGRPL